jgi:hypothetical protein
MNNSSIRVHLRSSVFYKNFFERCALNEVALWGIAGRR